MTTSKQIFAFPAKNNGSKPTFVWSKDSNYIAVGTENKYVYVSDKRGKIVAEKELPIKGRVQMLDWDNENECLAILVEGQPYIFLWSPFTTNFIE